MVAVMSGPQLAGMYNPSRLDPRLYTQSTGRFIVDKNRLERVPFITFGVARSSNVTTPAKWKQGGRDRCAKSVTLLMMDVDFRRLMGFAATVFRFDSGNFTLPLFRSFLSIRTQIGDVDDDGTTMEMPSEYLSFS